MRYTTPSGLRDLAMDLNARGYRAFPVKLLRDADGTFTKKPGIEGYHGTAPFSAEEIARWPWAKATALGWALPEGHVALDVDVKSGLKAGKEHLRLLRALYGVLPATATQRTPSCGLHLVFKLPRAVERFHREVPLHDGHADIDICHARHRFLTIYEEALFDQDVAVLPEAWTELITKKRSTPMPTVGAVSPASHEELLVKLAQAREGSRNDILNTSVFTLVTQGRWGAQTEAEVRQIAADIGLESDEIDDTIESASTAGEEQRKPAEQWYQSVGSDSLVRKRRNWSTLLMVAGHFRDLAAVHGMETGLSVREMGERLGVSHETAARALRTLKELGHLERASLWDRRRTVHYRLVIPERSKWDTHQPLASNAPSSRSKAAGGVSQEVHQLASDLYGHSAFIRMKDTTTFPKGVTFVVAAVHLGHTTVTDIASITGLSPATVRSGLHRLESAGLVDYDSKKTKTVRPFFDDPFEALTKWAESFGVEGHADILRQRHQDQRQRRDERLQRRRMRRDRTFQPTWPVRKPPQDSAGPGTPPPTGGPVG